MSDPTRTSTTDLPGPTRAVSDPALDETRAATRTIDPTQPGSMAAVRAPKGPLSPGDVIGNCEILAVIGQGGMGFIYKARDRELDRIVAVKLLAPRLAEDPRIVQRFRREARSMARLKHPGIVQVYAAGREEDLPHFVMELVDGESVAERLAKGPMSLNEICRIVMEVTVVLRVAHGQGILHRDIKPSNLMLDVDGRVRVLDFGLAKIVEDIENDGQLTHTREIMGSPHYMSPEQATGHPVDLRSDIYSLGATLFHMIAGSPPFTDSTILGILHKHATEPLSSLREIRPETPMEMVAIVEKSMAKDPGQRYENAQELLDDLALVGAAAMGLGKLPRPWLDLKRFYVHRTLGAADFAPYPLGYAFKWLICGLFCHALAATTLGGVPSKAIPVWVAAIIWFAGTAGLTTVLGRLAALPIRMRGLVHLENMFVIPYILMGAVPSQDAGGLFCLAIGLVLFRFRYQALRSWLHAGPITTVLVCLPGWIFTFVAAVV